MNTTKDIHLSHIKFTFDEEAFRILSLYLKNLAITFSSNPSKDEILEDIESHIAELLSINKNLNSVVSVLQVEDAIKILGTPEELAVEESNEENINSKKVNSNKKLFRDTEDNYIGGVARGLAHYFGVSPAWPRLLFILLFLLPIPPGSIIIYCIFWIVVPSAKTNADKIRMNGEAVSVNTIKKKIESVIPEVEKQVKEFDKKYARTAWGRFKFFIRRVSNFIISNSAKLFKILSIIFGFILMFYSFIGGVITSLIIFFASNIKYALDNATTSSEIIINGTTIYEINDFVKFDVLDLVTSIDLVLITAFGLLIIIPCIILFIIGLKLAFRDSYTINKMTMFILFALWIIGFMYISYIVGFTIIESNYPYNL
jgi:phage shock protein PspC (stress-responsive transcriptional regulator)